MRFSPDGTCVARIRGRLPAVAGGFFLSYEHRFMSPSFHKAVLVKGYRHPHCEHGLRVMIMARDDAAQAVLGGVVFSVVWYLMSGGESLLIATIGGACFALAWSGAGRVWRRS